MARRGNGEGSIYREAGAWRAVVTYYEAGKRKRLTATRRTRKEASEELASMQAKIANRPENADPNMTFADWADLWMENFVKPASAPQTIQRYRYQLNKYCKPRLGHHKLSKVTPGHVQGVISQMTADGIGAPTCRSVYGIFRTAFNRAVAIGLLTKSPTIGVTKPKKTRKPIEVFEPAELQKILKCAAGTLHYCMLRTAASTGMRQGEVLGLDWTDVRNGKVHVSRQLDTHQTPIGTRTTKTENSKRAIPLDDGMLAALEDHRKLLEGKGILKSHIFVSSKGEYIRPSNLTRRVWAPLLAEANVKYRTFHVLRHTYATHMLRNNVPINTVSKLLGHSSPSVTLNIYGHVVEADFDVARDAIAGITTPIATPLPLRCHPVKSHSGFSVIVSC